MINERELKELTEELANMSDDEFLENIKKILKKEEEKYLEDNIFQVKITMIKVLHSKKKLIIKRVCPSGLSITDINKLNYEEATIILKEYLYIKEPLECVINQGNKVEFEKMVTTV
jgi:hypothetical protein